MTTTLGPENVPPLPPPGYFPITEADKNLQNIAVNILKKGNDIGTVTYFTSEGHSYAGRIEPHPPAPERGLTEWHKGVTLYRAYQEPVVNNIATPQNVGAMGGATVGFMVGGPIGFAIGGTVGYLFGKFFKGSKP